MLRWRQSSGFSLLELMITISILGILIALGVPSLSAYIKTARLGTMAKSFYTGVQLARTEAIRLNQHVDFVQTSTPIAAHPELNAVPDGAGGNWVVRYTDPVLNTPQLVEARTVLEGGGAVPSMVAAGNPATISFNGLGGTVTAAAAQVDIGLPAGQCAPAGTVLCWRVAVSPGGQVRLCNPSVGAAAVDSRGC